MNYVSLFSGVGGFDLGLDRAGHTCVAQVEKDEHCQKVLRRHWPHVPRFDDVRTFGKENVDGTVELVCGGFPCTDLSNAGQRRGLAGEHSGLWFEFRRVVAELHPQWVLIENVPGLLSSAGGRDMGTILANLADLGYGWAYRVLDSRHFGVPQRRRRVFIVACAGGAIARAAAVLFESESVRGDSQAGAAAQQEVANTLGRGTRRRDLDGNGAYIPVQAFGWNVAGSERTHITRAGDYAQIGAQSQDAVYIRNPADDTEVLYYSHDYSHERIYDSATISVAVTAEAQRQYFTSAGVRRLMPVECERLQALPDHWTAWGINEKGKKVAISDTQRYKMTGNAVTTTVITWIGKRFT